jgi:hypothetical protein
MNRIFLASGLAAAALLTSCGGGSSSSSSTADASSAPAAPAQADPAARFPTGLALSSPVSMDPGEAVLAWHDKSPSWLFEQGLYALLRGELATASKLTRALIPLPSVQAAATHAPAYIKAANRINALLTGSSAFRTTPFFNADAFLSSPVNAGCYGPALPYRNHPDGADPADPRLPSGDLGLWTRTDSASGDVCAAAQLDARMGSISQRGNLGLMTLASLINVANAAGKALPAAGASLTLTSDMNSAFSASGLSFSSATMAQSAAAVWTYAVQFAFTDAHGLPHNAEISLSHTPGASTTQYAGRLTYAVTRDSSDLRNCPAISAGTVDVGTLVYRRSSQTAASLVQREGNYCGTGTVGSLASSVADFTADGQLDPAGKWTGSKGWANDFNRFGARYDPTTSQGAYAFGWQAGQGDGNSRLFNIGLNYNAATELRDGEAYFGHGDDIATSDGQIQGFICNWAGPGHSHRLSDYFQRQSISFNAATGQWELALGAPSSSNILYAPTNSCSDAGSGFEYDRNLNGVLGDDLVVVVTPDLQGKGASLTIPAAIAARGMVTPAF